MTSLDGIYQTLGAHSSDRVQTLMAKSRFKIDGLQLNGELLDPDRTISSYNIKEDTVLKGIRQCCRSNSAVVEKTTEMVEEATETVEETTEDVSSAFMNKLKEAFGRLGDVCGSLKSAISTEICRTLAHILGAAKLDDILTFVTRLVKEVKFELPEVLQRASNKILSDKDFIGIANSIGESWQSLGYSLGLNQVQIEHIILDNQTTRMRIVNMLKLWAKSNTGGPKAGTLLQTMWSCAGLNVHWGPIFKMFA